MPLLYGLFIIGIIMWLAGKSATNKIKGEKENSSLDRYLCVEGKFLAGFKCDLTGTEYKEAYKAIVNNVSEYEKGIFGLLKKYGRDTLGDISCEIGWRKNSEIFCKKNKEKRDKFIQCEKEYDAIVENFTSKKHPILRKYDNEKTFKELGWNTRHAWIKTVEAKYDIPSSPFTWKPWLGWDY